MKDETAYRLGVRAREAGAKCEPFEDALFWTYLTEKDLPIVPTIADYVDGYHAKQIAVQARRDQFRIVK